MKISTFVEGTYQINKMAAEATTTGTKAFHNLSGYNKDHKLIESSVHSLNICWVLCQCIASSYTNKLGNMEGVPWTHS